MEDKDFDKRIAQKLSSRTLDISENAWERVIVQLPEEKKSGLLKFWWIAAALVLGVFIWSPWQNNQEIPVTEVEAPVNMPENTIEKTLQSTDVKTIQPLVENTKIKKEKKSQDNQKSHYKNNIASQMDPIEAATEEEPLTTGLATVSSQKFNINHSNTELINTVAQNNEIDYNKLILHQIKESNPTYRINAGDLLQLTESEMISETHKPIKEVIFEKFKNTVKDLNMALR